MSDTPRTDAATRMAFSGEHMVPIEDAQKLERELAVVTEQRDELADALRGYMAHHRLRGFVTKHQVAKADKALAVIEGGQP